MTPISRNQAVSARGHRARPYTLAAAVILGVAIAAEAARFVWPWPNIPYHHSAIISAVLVAIWTLSLGALLLRRRSAPLSKMAWVLTFAAPFAMILHSLLGLVVTESLMTLPYAFAGVTLGFCLKRTWDGPELRIARDLSQEEARTSPSRNAPRTA